MTQRTAEPGAPAGAGQYPPDLETMRATALRAILPDASPDALPPTGEELDTLTATLRGHLDLLAPQVEQLSRKLPHNSIPRYCALACVGEAHGKLRAGLDPRRLSTGMPYARKLARVLIALCDHYEHISTGREAPERTALRRLGEHCAACPTCMCVNEAGANANAPCDVADQLYEEWRQARRGLVPAP